MVKLKFFGLGGQGIVTAAKILSGAVSIHEDKYAITVPSYGHERRGAPVNTSIIIDDKPVLPNCFVYDPDIVLVADISFLDRKIPIGDGIGEKGILILNTGDDRMAQLYKNQYGFHDVYYANATQTAISHIKRSTPNSALLGILARTGIVQIESIGAAIHEMFGSKAGPANVAAAKEAYDATKKI